MQNIAISLKNKDATMLLRIQNGQPINVIDDATLGYLAESLKTAEADPKIMSVIVWGGPKNFAAGAKVQELLRKSREFLKTDQRQEYWRQVMRFEKPLLAAVNGVALGAGHELVMNCDIILAGKNARFGQPEINLGLIPGAGGTQRLAQAIGKSRAMQMVLTGSFLSADEAKNSGLVSEVCVDELVLERALEIAHSINGKSMLALKAAKKSIQRCLEKPLEDGLTFEYEQFSQLADTADRTEGITAFLEKRTPHFQGK